MARSKQIHGEGAPLALVLKIRLRRRTHARVWLPGIRIKVDTRYRLVPVPQWIEQVTIRPLERSQVRSSRERIAHSIVSWRCQGHRTGGRINKVQGADANVVASGLVRNPR